MPQFFVDQKLISGGLTRITGGEAHHIIHVLRLRVGDWLIISDGRGRSFKAKIGSLKSKTVEVILEDEMVRRIAAPAPDLAFAVIKHDRTEYIIQKAVELGCTRLIPFFSTRTVPQYRAGVSEKKHSRWQKIALEAARQSGLPVKPEVLPPTEFGKLCGSFNEYKRVLLFWEGETQRDLQSQAANLKSPLLLVIGPEGGFSLEETQLAQKSGAATISLGQQIMRVETAALVALGIVQYELGNLSVRNV